MGELSDYRLNGDDCERCGKVLGGGQGFPRLCDECESAKYAPPPRKRRAKRGKRGGKRHRTTVVATDD